MFMINDSEIKIFEKNINVIIGEIYVRDENLMKSLYGMKNGWIETVDCLIKE